MNVRSLSIIIPAYNEERTIREVLGVVHALRLPQGITKEVIVVNDKSKDGTSAEVKRFQQEMPDAGVVLVEQPVNKGKGAAIHRGMQEATGDMLIIQDADVELDPNEIVHLLEPVLRGEAEIASTKDCRIRVSARRATTRTSSLPGSAT
jgi:glycosyltransferase involved in cell wall biosynthesis